MKEMGYRRERGGGDAARRSVMAPGAGEVTQSSPHGDRDTVLVLRE